MHPTKGPLQHQSRLTHMQRSAREAESVRLGPGIIRHAGYEAERGWRRLYRVSMAHRWVPACLQWLGVLWCAVARAGRDERIARRPKDTRMASEQLKTKSDRLRYCDERFRAQLRKLRSGRGGASGGADLDRQWLPDRK